LNYEPFGVQYLRLTDSPNMYFMKHVTLNMNPTTLQFWMCPFRTDKPEKDKFEYGNHSQDTQVLESAGLLLGRSGKVAHSRPAFSAGHPVCLLASVGRLHRKGRDRLHTCELSYRGANEYTSARLAGSTTMKI